jgi:Spy/CpxP family protein refolding chaperone
MKLSRLGIAVASAALALSLATAASAQRPGRGRGNNTLTAFIPKLQLTDEQKSKLQPAMEAFRAEQQRIRGLQDRAEQRTARMKATETLETAVKGVLTADQQKQLDALRAEAREYAGMGPMAIRLTGLNLTAEQKGKVKEIAAKYQPELEKLRGEQTDRQAALQQMRELNMKMSADVRAVLTPDQQKAFDAAAPQRRRQNNQ